MRRTEIYLKPDVEAVLEEMARLTHQHPNQVIKKIIQNYLRRHALMEVSWAAWVRLTPREQQITALIVMGYTDQQVARQLFIAPCTVTTHVKNIRIKTKSPDRHHLRELFGSWDFSSWDR